MSAFSYRSRSIAISTIASLATLGLSSVASADPLPGEVIKFQQLPLGDLQTDPASKFPGHDELSTASPNTAIGGFSGTFAADDFSDNVSQPIVHVQWWGSYLPSSAPPNQVQHFLISFESDVPAGPPPSFSHPGQSLGSQTVNLGALAPASGTFTETAVPTVPGGPDGALYQYNAELAIPFPEQAGVTYWLKIAALTGTNDPTQWGWHNRDYTIPDPYAAPPGDSLVGMNIAGQAAYHYLDDAVTGNVNYIPAVPPPQNLIETNMSPLSYSTNPAVDGFGNGVIAPSEDLAFNLFYTQVPEPVALPLLGMGFFLFRRHRRRASTLS
jgi:hypothetical protein